MQIWRNSLIDFEELWRGQTQISLYWHHMLIAQLRIQNGFAVFMARFLFSSYEFFVEIFKKYFWCENLFYLLKQTFTNFEPQNSGINNFLNIYFLCFINYMCQTKLWIVENTFASSKLILDFHIHVTISTSGKTWN